MEDIQKTRGSSMLKRRGLLAGATALGAALVAKLGTASKAEAANGDPLILGQNNTATTTTSLTGVAGTTALFTSVSGGGAIWAINDSNGTTILAQGAGASGIQAESASNAGVVGASNTNAGVYGQGQYGAWGVGLGQTGVGLFGAVGANQISTGALAGLFDGPIVVNGNTTVNGDFAASGIKSAIVPTANGTVVHLYSIEAPESFFEDFGMATTGADGSAPVTIDQTFREVAKTDRYLVFLTAYNQNNGLFVEQQGESSFTVRDSEGAAGVRFGWRIVAKRADVNAARFAPASAQSRGLNVDRIPRPDIVSPSPSSRPNRRP